MASPQVRPGYSRALATRDDDSNREMTCADRLSPLFALGTRSRGFRLARVPKRSPTSGPSPLQHRFELHEINLGRSLVQFVPLKPADQLHGISDGLGIENGRVYTDVNPAAFFPARPLTDLAITAEIAPVKTNASGGETASFGRRPIAHKPTVRSAMRRWEGLTASDSQTVAAKAHRFVSIRKVSRMASIASYIADIEARHC